MGWDAPWHWVILAIVVIALFGYKKLPDASRAVGRSLRIFKTEIKGMTEDDTVRANKTVTAVVEQPAEPAPAADPAPAPQPAEPQAAATGEPPAADNR